MKKNALLLGFGTLVMVVWTGLFLWSCAQPFGYVDINKAARGPRFPKAVISDYGPPGYDESFPGKEFDIVWEPVGTRTQAEIDDALVAVYEDWRLFEKMTDPRAHVRPTDYNDPLDYAVWVPGMGGAVRLDNNGRADIELRRCWPRSLLGSAPTYAGWIASQRDRITEFKEAVKRIKAMRAALQASPLYETEVNGEKPLQQLDIAMGGHIAYPPTDAETFDGIAGKWDRPRWAAGTDVASSGGLLSSKYDTSSTGPLYEYYFGYAPNASDYLNPGGPYSFPVP
jgi:hypothetical protein